MLVFWAPFQPVKRVDAFIECEENKKVQRPLKLAKINAEGRIVCL